MLIGHLLYLFKYQNKLLYFAMLTVVGSEGAGKHAASELFQPLDDNTHAPVTGNEQDVSSAEVSAVKNRSGDILHFKERSERDRDGAVNGQ